MTDIKDYDRISERIWVQYGDTIYDKESYDKAFNDYMSERSPNLSIAQDTILRKEVYAHTAPKISRISEKERGLRVQRQMTSGIEKRKLEKGEHQYVGTGKVNGQIVYVYLAEMKLRGKTIFRYRDRKGRFVKRI